MNRPAMNPSRRTPLQMPGQLPSVSSSPMRPLATGRPYPIRPTETFSFADELESASREQRHQRRSGSGGGVLLLVLMLLAGSAGYVAVKYRVWQDTGPVVERAQELLRSLRTLAPGASPETLARPAPVRAPVPATTPTQPRLAPEVVPITRDPEPGKTSKAGMTTAAKTTAAKAAATAAPTTAATTTAARHHPMSATSATSAQHRRAVSGAAQKSSATRSDPTEEELLAPSAN
jgi:hypothetical protein